MRNLILLILEFEIWGESCLKNVIFKDKYFKFG